MRRIFPAVLILSVAFAGCGAKEQFKEGLDASRSLKKHSTTDVLKEVANDKYTPPADGKLTDGQIQMYLKVREHEKAIAQLARKEAQEHADAAKKAGEKSLSGMMEGFKTLGSVADMATADIRAAHDLHYNTQEYLWVKGQILAASVSAMAAKSAEVMNATFDASYQQIKKSYDEARDETTKKMYADMLAGYDKQKQEMTQKTQEEPAVAYNRQLLSKYENALNAYATEVSKWEDKPGEAQKSVEQWNKDTDKAIQDAKAQKQ
jgi:hypothetical protein